MCDERTYCYLTSNTSYRSILVSPVQCPAPSPWPRGLPPSAGSRQSGGLLHDVDIIEVEGSCQETICDQVDPELRGRGGVGGGGEGERGGGERGGGGGKGRGKG